MAASSNRGKIVNVAFIGSASPMVLQSIREATDSFYEETPSITYLPYADKEDLRSITLKLSAPIELSAEAKYDLVVICLKQPHESKPKDDYAEYKKVNPNTHSLSGILQYYNEFGEGTHTAARYVIESVKRTYTEIYEQSELKKESVAKKIDVALKQSAKPSLQSIFDKHAQGGPSGRPVYASHMRVDDSKGTARYDQINEADKKENKRRP